MSAERAAAVRFGATAVGAIAVLLWSTLAVLTTWAYGLPPFQLLAMSFSVAAALGALFLVVRGRALRGLFYQPAAAWALGVGGLFGYHFFYFVALSKAPPVHASLIAYLWPLLIVLFSALLPGHRLRWFHVVGAGLGFAGAVLLVTDGARVALRSEYALGYAAAFACALTWSGYSVMNRRFSSVPTDVIAGFCVAVALLAIAAHLTLERTVTPNLQQWLAAVALGIGPVGAAFFVWDYGTKHGDLRVLGVLSYAAPLLSTLLLIVFGKADPTGVVGASCGLIIGGALLASKEYLRGAAFARRRGGNRVASPQESSRRSDSTGF